MRKYLDLYNHNKAMVSASMGWPILGLNISVFLLLAFQGSNSWIHFAAIVLSFISCLFAANAVTMPQTNLDSVDNALRSATEIRKEENKAKLKELFDEYKQLQDSVNEEEENYAIAEALHCTRANKHGSRLENGLEYVGRATAAEICKKIEATEDSA